MVRTRISVAAARSPSLAGKRFRVYSFATMVIVLACGAITGTYASQVQADLPAPGVGVWERISIATFMVRIVVLAASLLRAPHDCHPAGREIKQERRST